ncbi:MAG: SGNH/GDSL hydrolase family protein [Pseudomonadota bacterium]
MKSISISLKCLILCFSSLFTIQGYAAPYSKIIVFGDSLSDTGNVSRVTFGFLPGAGYADGRFSDGSVWVEYLSTALGLTYDADSNYAWGGAESGTGGASAGPISVLGVTAQVGQFIVDTGGTADPDALYFIVVGGNDLMRGVSETSSTEDISNVVNETVGNIMNAVDTLSIAGAVNLVVSGIDVSMTPRALNKNEDGRQAWKTASDQFNQSLATALNNVSTSSINFFDLATITDNVLANAADFGITNTTMACLVNGQLCENPSTWFFIDDIHPTTAAHEIIADAAFSVVAMPGFSTSSLQLNLPAVEIPGNQDILYDLTFNWNPEQANFTLLNEQVKTTTSQMRVQAPVEFDGAGMTVDVLVDNVQTVRVRLDLLPDVDAVRMGVTILGAQ